MTRKLTNNLGRTMGQSTSALKERAAP